MGEGTEARRGQGVLSAGLHLQVCGFGWKRGVRVLSPHQGSGTVAATPPLVAAGLGRGFSRTAVGSGGRGGCAWAALAVPFVPVSPPHQLLLSRSARAGRQDSADVPCSLLCLAQVGPCDRWAKPTPGHTQRAHPSRHRCDCRPQNKSRTLLSRPLTRRVG